MSALSDELEDTDWGSECERLRLDIECDCYDMARAYVSRHSEDEDVNLDEDEVREAFEELHETWLDQSAGDRMSQSAHDKHYDERG